ncbi:MAG: hypothetical protein KY475_14220 [Planctomycetes bacterium]|nr:hypothetical protein [Planctomycetota bacterium]
MRMADRLQAAHWRYERIRPKDGDKDSFRKGDELSHWLQADVCPVVSELLERPDFRGHAQWSIDCLQEGAATEARSLLEAVERGLLSSAQRMAKLTRERFLARILAGIAADEFPNYAGCAGEPARASDASPGTITDFISTRPWCDLVSIYDYFGPADDLNLRNRETWLGPNSENTQVADFLPLFKPHLHLPGDFVVRCLMVRIDYWLSGLQRLRMRCEDALRNGPDDDAEIRERLREAVRDIHEPLQKLETLCIYDSQAPLREACAALVQAFAAYNPQADFSWLGPAGTMAGNASTIRYFVERRADAGITDRIAAALHEIGPLYRSDVDPDLLIEKMVRQSLFVLAYGKGRQDLYWSGRHLEVDWTRRGRAWTLIVALAENAKRGQGVDRCDDLGISLKDARYDLKRLLPADLFSLITVSQGVHRLNLSADDLFVAQFDQLDRLMEIK